MHEQSHQKKRTARLEARTTPAVVELVQRAANLEGRSVSDFIVRAAQEAAQAAIEQRELIELSRADQERFAAALLDPEPVAPALKQAAKAHRRLVRPS